MNQEILAKALGGDTEAYERLVRQYQGILLGYAVNRMSCMSDAEEVVQLTFIRAYEQLCDYQPEMEFGVWLCVICKHFILTELERHGQHLKYGASNRNNQANAGRGSDKNWWSEMTWKEEDLSKLYLTMLHRLGVECESFGKATQALREV
ncbi:MAG: RNA polymerase sigma factor [Planctomycetota bacterium]